MTAPMVVEGAMTGEMFLAYVEQCLVPTLRRNHIVVMDNCRALGPGIRDAIEKAGAIIRYFQSTPLILIRLRCLTASQGVPAQARRPNCSRPQSSYSLLHPTGQPSGMRQLFQPCGVCFNMSRNPL